MSRRRPRVLFLCTGNACRSQMAEGWARHLLAESLDVCSAGTAPHGVDARAIAVMREAGVNISAHHSKSVAEVDAESIDLVVTVCASAHEACPVFPGSARVIHHGFDDPPRLASEAHSEREALDHYRRVRDEIRTFVESLLSILAEEPLGGSTTS